MQPAAQIMLAEINIEKILVHHEKSCVGIRLGKVMLRNFKL